jgi:ubiquinone/menaquinone biosynthesis C-methylase UbiE
MQFILGKWISKPIYVAAALGIADHLVDGPLQAEILAERCNVHPASLYRLLRALAAVGIFTEGAENAFGLTPMGECLRSDRLGPIALMFHSSWHDSAWDQLLPAVKSGIPAFEIAHGASAYDWFNKNPAAFDQFQAANSAKANRFHQAVVAAYDFSRSTRVADIGGGKGAFMIALLSAQPQLKGLVFDLPEVVKSTEKLLGSSGAIARCRVVAGDFFKAVPGGADLYMLANVLHNWDDDHCKRILSNCHNVMAPGAKLLVIEALVSPGNTFSIAKLLDLETMVMGGGRERTEEEFRKLLDASGFKDLRVIPMMDGNAVLESSRV